ncbi:UDP-glucose 4-epimerase GalE [Rhodoferax sp.]|uniref:UDP-glucose 4-epimerase GalE n=1 Tax=Rhodoferax sp. TaxID=50421 RepID=UPI00261AEF6B|nr:UDP-glucose 4-epimerase GalE [Rhodoferax sp.]MDD2808225.1 UDP-glucose 4-epimerase GalE [Rhodoferax sp.]MDD4941982.1 UDP-glucose 4-epimerase GalE [Rhodoferax sp.]MDD5480350.1 UDP-glucose 4-epimerase GalE [Rhodoferax sp.]
MKHVLVTGGAGYIGSHACKALAAAGYVPVTFDNLVYGHRSAVRWGPFVHGDISDRAALDAALRTWQPVAVMHFAAFAYVGESVTNPGKYYRNNVVGTLTLLEAMRDAGVKQFVFSSTCATYGVPSCVPISEDHAQNPINAYGASKLMIERMLKDFNSAHSMRSMCLRYFNAAGADSECETGEAHDPETHLIPLVLDAAAGVRPNVTVFGTDYPTSDGTCVRDYIHVTDLAQAHVLALQALQAGAASTAYNLGNGKGFSVRQVIDVAQQVTGLNVPVVLGAQRAGDPPALVGDARRIQAELGWQPKHADLADIIGTAWRWHQMQRMASK